jgi:hypothetical protein
MIYTGPIIQIIFDGNVKEKAKKIEYTFFCDLLYIEKLTRVIIKTNKIKNSEFKELSKQIKKIYSKIGVIKKIEYYDGGFNINQINSNN